MRALVLGAGGFVGHNLVKRLKLEGHYVIGVDLKLPLEDTPADGFLIADLAKHSIPTDFDRIYQLAADMGGAGFVFTGDNDADILTNSLSINLNVLKQLKDFKGKLFFSSSVCVYPASGQRAYPADPPSNYGWEKLTSERLFRAYNLDTRIARFHNTYGPTGPYKGGREKSPAALCRKVIEADKEIEIWGDGKQVRPFMYIDDLLDNLELLMNSTIQQPVTFRPKRGVTINYMVDLICDISGKDLKKKYTDGPTGEQTRLPNGNFGKSKVSLKKGLEKTYRWINNEIHRNHRN